MYNNDIVLYTRLPHYGIREENDGEHCDVFF